MNPKAHTDTNPKEKNCNVDFTQWPYSTNLYSRKSKMLRDGRLFNNNNNNNSNNGSSIQIHFGLTQYLLKRENRYYHIQSISGLVEAWLGQFSFVNFYFPVERSHGSRESELWSREKIMTFSPGMKFASSAQRKVLETNQGRFPYEFGQLKYDTFEQLAWAGKYFVFFPIVAAIRS